MLPSISAWLRRLTCPRPASRAGRRPLAVLPLEGRLVPTGLPPSVLISGASQVGEAAYGPYTLNLTAVDPENDPVTEWTIDWGDGSPAQLVPGNPSSVSHVFPEGAGYLAHITAWALVGAETFAAKVSTAGSGGGVLPQFDPTQFPGNSMGFVTSGRDYNGDGFGDLYVSSGSAAASAVDVLDGKTGALLTPNGLITSANGLGQPWDLAFGPDGNLYVSSFGSGRVLEYDWATGQVSAFISGLFYPRSLTFDGAGNLYVSESGAGAIWKFDGTGQRVGAGPFADAPSDHIDVMRFGPDGNMYCTPSSDNSIWKTILKFDVALGQFSEFIPASSSLVRGPAGLAFGPDGDLYVVGGNDSTANLPQYIRLLQFDVSNGALLGVFDHPQMTSPGGMTFGGDGSLYVAELENRVRRFDGPLAASTATGIDVTVLDARVGTYTSNPRAVIPSDLRTYSWPINVPDAGQVVDVDVGLDITHPNDSDLLVDLVSPTGRRVRLISLVGGTGDNFKGTILDDEAATAIAQGSAPFTGRFRPSIPLGGFDGEAAQGTWRLEISDRVKAAKGTLNTWSLTITRAVGPAPLLAAGAPGVGAAPAPLTEAQLKPTVAEAVRRWNRARLTAAERQLLRTMTVQIGDLDGATLGRAAGTAITLDRDAAGWGWFADPTPRSDAEFRRAGDQGERGRMDLLTAVVHELGHVLGRSHGDGAMGETLEPGTRETIVPAVSVGRPAKPAPAGRPGWFLASGRARR